MASELRVDKIHNEGGDNDSGLDMSTNDVVAVKIAGSEKARIHSDGKLGVGETAPLGLVHTKVTDVGASASAQGNLLVLEDTENGLSILSSTSAAGYINFGDSDDNNIGMIIYDHSNNRLRFFTNATEHLYITNDGVMYYPEHSTDGGTSANAIIQSSNGKIERSTASSRKLKENIKDITMDCTKIQNLKVREFDYKSNYVTSTERADIGLIAEEVDAVEPMWTTQGYIDETDCKFKTDEYIKENSKTKHAIDIHWRRLQVGMLKEIQRLHTEIETLKTKVAALEDK